MLTAGTSANLLSLFVFFFGVGGYGSVDASRLRSVYVPHLGAVPFLGGLVASVLLQRIRAVDHHLVCLPQLYQEFGVIETLVLESEVLRPHLSENLPRNFHARRIRYCTSWITSVTRQVRAWKAIAALFVRPSVSMQSMVSVLAACRHAKHDGGAPRVCHQLVWLLVRRPLERDRDRGASLSAGDGGEPACERSGDPASYD